MKKIWQRPAAQAAAGPSIDPAARLRIFGRVMNTTLAVNLCLAAFKLAAGILGKSSAMLSDAVHTISDLATTLIAMLGIRFAGKSSDDGHPYGHQRIESLVALVLAFILALTAVLIGKAGVEKLIAGPAETPIPGVFAIVAAVVSILTQEALFQLASRNARKISSPSMMADAWHHRSDALSSIGSFIGIGCARLGLWYMEPAASLVICLLILRAAWQIGRAAAGQLIDQSAPAETNAAIQNAAMGVPGVVAIDSLHTRLHASWLYADLEVRLPRELSFTDAHAVCEAVHAAVENKCPQVLHCSVLASPDGAASSLSAGHPPAPPDA